MRSSSTWVKLYDLIADPHENQDRVEDSPIARRLCDVYLGEGLATPDKKQRLRNVTVRRRFKAGEARIGPDVRRQLEALGYFGDDDRDDEPDDEPDDE